MDHLSNMKSCINGVVLNGSLPCLILKDNELKLTSLIGCSDNISFDLPSYKTFLLSNTTFTYMDHLDIIFEQKNAVTICHL
jgi:hypothetical protein